MLAATLDAMQITTIPLTVKPDGGTGVVIGIVDFGCDFVHRNFRDADGSSRILTIWNQGATAPPSSPFGYGRRYDKPAIDAALKTANPYLALGYAPSHDPSGDARDARHRHRRG